MDRWGEDGVPIVEYWTPTFEDGALMGENEASRGEHGARIVEDGAPG